MSARAPARKPGRWTGRTRRTGTPLTGPAAIAAVLVWLAAPGCNGPLSFDTLPDAGTGGAPVIGGLGGNGFGGTTGGGGVIGIGGMTGVGGLTGTGGTIVDAGPDVPQSTPDARPDLAPEAGPYRPPDVRDTGVDANGPVVCRTDTDCRFPTLALHCLIPSGQTTGSCVECSGDTECATAGLRKCDTMAGSATFHHCVECMNGSVATDCPSLSSEHGSTCNPEHHCLQGCSDDSTAESACAKFPIFMCQGSGGSEPDHQCADCLSQGDCATGLRCINFVCLQCTLNTDCPTGQVCDNVGGRCVPCRDSTDCRGAGFRLCDPVSHTCVANTN